MSWNASGLPWVKNNIFNRLHRLVIVPYGQEPYQCYLDIKFLNVIFLLKINLICVFFDKNLTMANIRYSWQSNRISIWNWTRKSLAPFLLDSLNTHLAAWQSMRHKKHGAHDENTEKNGNSSSPAIADHGCGRSLSTICHSASNTNANTRSYNWWANLSLSTSPPAIQQLFS